MSVTTLIIYLASGGAALDRLLVLIRDWPAKRRYLKIMNDRAEIENDRLREQRHDEVPEPTRSTAATARISKRQRHGERDPHPRARGR